MPVALGLVAFAIYLSSSSRWVSGGDSGELITSAARLGIAHPPGYPLYALLAHAFTWLPFGSVAWRVNLFSAACSAAAAGVLARWAIERGAGLAGALLAAALFALAPGVWAYSTVAEVFALNNLLVALLLLASSRAWRDPEARPATGSPRARGPQETGFSLDSFALFAGILGLGLSNHHTIAFLGAPIGLWLARGRTRKAVLIASACFAAGLLPYVYLPAFGSRQLLSSWGDPSTWDGFWAHVLRREYGTFQLAASGRGVADLGANLVSFASFALRNSWGVAALPVLFVRRLSPLERAWVFASLAYVLFFSWLANATTGHPIDALIRERFWQMPLLVLVSIGAAWLGERVRSSPWPARSTQAIGLPARFAGAVPSAISALVWPALAVHSWERMDQSANDSFDRFGRAVLQELPRDALLLTMGDHVTNTVRYLQEVEGVRRDVRAVNQVLLQTPWHTAFAARRFPEIRWPPPGLYGPGRGGYTLQDLADANLGRMPIYVSSDLRAADSSVPAAGRATLPAREARYLLWPEGLADRVAPASGHPDPARQREVNRRILGIGGSADYSPPDPRAFPPGTWEHFIYQQWKDAREWALVVPP